MSKKNVVVKKLKSAEALGSCTVIASDKTGTLTLNEQTAKKILLPNGLEYSISGTGFLSNGEVYGEKLEYAREIGLLGYINNEASVQENEYIGDSIDVAFLVLGQKLHVSTSDILIIDEIPYESENQYSAIFYEKNGKVYCTVKGSLEVVYKFCSSVHLLNSKNQKIRLQEQNESLATSGYRVITIANGEVKKKKEYSVKDIKDLTFMGMVAFIDPIRPDVKKSIQQCKRAGIKTLMITGDHPSTAFSIAGDLKLVNSFTDVTTGEELEEEYRKGIHKFDDYIASKIVFARVTPLQKLHIIESLKRQGEFVAVTGDGVNDAPALKAANLGIAVGSGTDIAIEASDMIILDDSFQSIVAGILEGRIAYSNIKKIIYFLISCGLAEVLFFCLSILFDMDMPLVAIQLLWLNVVTDGIQDLALSFEGAEEDILKKPPISPKESIFNKDFMQDTLFSGILIGFLVFISWIYFLKILHMDVYVARGYVMALMVFMQNFHVLNSRSEEHSFLSVPFLRNPFVLFSIVSSILLQIFVMKNSVFSHILKTSPISFRDGLYLFLFSTLVLWIVEFYKKLKYTSQKK